MKLLLLGGTRDALSLAQRLIEANVTLIYSIAGLVRSPELTCETHSGGFSAYDPTTKSSGIAGLAQFITDRNISLIVDATHPYAQQISAHAAEAAQLTGISYWPYTRPAWPDTDLQPCTAFTDVPMLLPLLENCQRPFFTLGQSLLQHTQQRPTYQHWIVRSAIAPDQPISDQHITHLTDIGPFDYEQELALLKQYKVDALICKNSGSQAVYAKIRAAHALGITLFVQERPPAPSPSASTPLFSAIDPLFNAIVIQNN